MRAISSTFVCLGLVASLACATNPVTGKRELSFLSEAQEIAIGQQSDAEVRRDMGVYDDPELQRYVSDIGDRLAKLSHRPQLPWQFTVVDHSAKDGSGNEANKTLHRIDKSQVIKEVTDAGFKLAKEGNMLRKPEDTRDFNVNKERNKDDRFVLAFEKP